MFAHAAHAQSQNAAPQVQVQITHVINDGQRVSLQRATRPEANAANDRGAVADDLPLPHMLLQLQRSSAQEQTLNQLIEQLHNPASPNFHHWLTPADFGARFGVAPQDQQTITTWLQQHGFQVNFAYPNGTLIDFSGTAGEVREAFHTEIHRLSVMGKSHFANMSDPQIPAALAPAIAGIVGLHDFKPQRQYQPRPAYTLSNGDDLVAPADLATIYNINPLLTSGISGQGQTIAVIEDTDVYSTADWSTFRSTFGLSSYSGGSFTQLHPAPSSGSNNCSDPGSNADDGEAILDAEWASAAAPSAAIDLVSCADPGGTGDGLIIALQNLINGASPPPIISISYGECEAQNTDNASYNAAYQQAVAEGISVFVAAGDWGPAVCDASFDDGVVARDGIAVNGLASTPYNVAVGGTDFGDVYDGQQADDWNATNTSTYGSARSYVPEIPWNNTCASTLVATYVTGNATTYGSSGFCNDRTETSQYPFLLSIVAGSGGPSTLYSKPSWQAGFAGIQNDGARDLPDVALFSGNGIWGHYLVFCWSDTANGGAPCTGAPSNWSGAGGTSFASPIMAGIQALVDQQNGGSQGNPDPVYYALAAAEYGSGGSSACNSSNGNGVSTSCVFYDITQGDNDVPCAGTNNCYRPSGTYGVLSTSDSIYQQAYGTTTGWDFATGIGSVNAYNLVHGWGPTITVQITGNGSVSSAPEGISCGSVCSAAFSRADNDVNLLESPAPGWTFVGWGGACSGDNVDCAVSLNAASTVTATFTNQNFTLAVAVTGNGNVTASGGGLIDCGAEFGPSQICSAAFPANQQVTLNESANGNNAFTGWSGACSGSGACTVTAASGTVSVGANFAEIYPVTYAESGDGTFSCAPQLCKTSLVAGQQATVTAVPAPNWSLYSWGGVCSSTSGGNCTFNVTGPTTVMATFVLAQSVGQAAAPNTWSYTCTDTDFDNLNGALAGTAPWTFTDSAAALASSNEGQPSPGDIVEILNVCLGDVTIPVSNLTITSHNDQPPLSGAPDGFDGQVEITNASNISFNYLTLSGPTGGFTPGTSNFTGSEVANLYVHDGGTASLNNNTLVVSGPMNGIRISRSAAIVMTSGSDVGYNGLANVTGYKDGVAITEGGSLSADNTTEIYNNANGVGIALDDNASAELSSFTISGNGAGQILATNGSSVHLNGASVTQQTGTNPAVQILGRSSLVAAGGSIENTTGGAIVASGASNVILHGEWILSLAQQQSAAEASANSSIILAGGNTIVNNGSGGVAIQIDHSSSLLQENGAQLGYSNAAETISGAGSVQEQSAIDLGRGTISGVPSLTWTLSGSEAINVQQNSTFKLSGGATISGGTGIKLQQGANGVLSEANGGTNSATIMCTNSANNPFAHLLNTAASPVIPTYNLNEVLAGISGAINPGQINVCLGF